MKARTPARLLASAALAWFAFFASVSASFVAVPCAHAQETKIAALKAETKSKPKDGAAAFALARAYRRAGRWAEAKTEAARAAAISTGEEQVKARYELALVEFDQGVTNKALPTPPSLTTCKNVK